MGMEAAFAEVSLALFTTLFIVGAGAFVFTSIAHFVSNFSSEERIRINKWQWVPFIVIVVSFLAAVTHLQTTKLWHGLYLPLNVSQSPLTQEVFVAGIFTLLALIYLILSQRDVLKDTAHKVFQALLIILGIVSAVFVGLAYHMETIVTWSSWYPVFALVGMLFATGSAFGLFVIRRGKSVDTVETGNFKIAHHITSIGGFVLAAIMMFLYRSFVQGIETPFYNGAALASELNVFFFSFIILGILSVVINYIALKKNKGSTLALIATIIFTLALLASRFFFYGTYIAVGV